MSMHIGEIDEISCHHELIIVWLRNKMPLGEEKLALGHKYATQIKVRISSVNGEACG